MTALNLLPTSNNQIGVLHKLLESELKVSAPLIWKLAPNSCFINNQKKQPCLGYHQIWQYLLVLRITKSLRSDSDFLIDSFREYYRGRDNYRVLVSGAADYGLLSHILWAARLENVTPLVSILDRCNTPLVINRWYAKRQGIGIKTINADALDFVCKKSFDCICTHSFLGWFSLSDKLKLLKRWHDNLVDEGIVITTTRLRPDSSPYNYSEFNEQESEILLNSVLKSAENLSGTVDFDTKELIEAVYRYAQSKHRFPISTKEMLVELFEQAGFDILNIFEGGDTSPAISRPSGPIEGASNRLNIIASKR